MQAYVRVTRFISQLCGFAAAGLIVAAVLVVCHMVFVRYVLNGNTAWQTDFTTYCLIGATFIGSPYVLLTRGHVNVDVLPHYAGPRVRWWLALIAGMLTLVFALVVTVLTFQLWREAFVNHWVSDTMSRTRLWIPYASMPIGLGLLALQCVAQLIGLISGREPPFGTAKAHKA